ncbi:MAG: VWA domain-containing protein [Armatimonadetes bacterium]|nr:VWA domain-containing protein [Armatimonadota bacterium]
MRVTCQEGHEAERLPLNVALAIDRSDSMSGESKLENVKAAACEMIDELEAFDTLALVDFSSSAKVSAPSAAVTDKERLKGAVRKLRPGGMTNLGGALQASADEVCKSSTGQQVSRVLLLTDGEATTGERNPKKLTKAAQTLWGAGISLTTLGVGHGYEEKLLAEMARVGGGNHYYISSKDDCDRIFREELASLTGVVAKEAALTVRTPEDVPSRVVNEGYTPEAGAGWVRIRLDDIEREGATEVVFELRTPARPPGPSLLATVDLTYLDPGTGPRTQSEDVWITFTGLPAEVRSGINKDVLRAWEEVESFARAAEIVSEVKAGKKKAEAGAGELTDLAKTLLERRSSKAGDLKVIATTILDRGGVDEHLSKTVVMEASKTMKGKSK